MHILTPIYSILDNYRSPAKKGPLMKERPLPTFGPISSVVSVYPNERPPGSKLRVVFENHGLKCLRISSNERHEILHRNQYKASLHIEGRS